jgi:SAM-dependent methyltransferase
LCCDLGESTLNLLDRPAFHEEIAVQKSIRDFIEICRDNLPFDSPIYEFGAFTVPGQETDAVRPLFPDHQYIGCDLRDGHGVDRMLDLHALDLPDNCAGSVLCLDTLEHVKNPQLAISEMFRVLRPGGIAIISSVFDFPIHNYPDDYWRFTPQGLRLLMSDFSPLEIFSYGRTPESPQSVVGVGQKSGGLDMTAVCRLGREWEKWQSGLVRAL